jgi:hypothetical protein
MAEVVSGGWSFTVTGDGVTSGQQASDHSDHSDHGEIGEIGGRSR